MVDTLVRDGVSILFCIGGDGTLRGASAIAAEAADAGASAWPWSASPRRSTTTSTGSSAASGSPPRSRRRRGQSSLPTPKRAAHWNGIGLVKLMGRHAGFIAANATLARPDVNLCLVPEVPFTLDGDGGLLDVLAERLTRRHHAVVVVAEGAGQELLPRSTAPTPPATCASPTSAPWLRDRLIAGLSARGIRPEVKYLDPSYEIRALPANAYDAAFCLSLGQMAAHAGHGRQDRRRRRLPPPSLHPRAHAARDRRAAPAPS